MARGAVRRQEIERAMRAHPAGAALRAGSGVGARGLADEVGREAAIGAAPPRTPLRLTARGRRLVTALTVAGGIALTALLHGLVGGGEPATLHLAGQSSVVVRPGDTLWSIASSVAGDDDVRAVVDRIRGVNGMRGSALVPGEVLRLP
jgi:nucleoid-associated protein YgaU